ncbi:MAG: BlaI/MecI/CopY family transcriptional regulator [Arachidicoccus sp.]|nr:BlaI/MecI/CopY family transcriptional regulator [Arachidicoccus sp.]
MAKEIKLTEGEQEILHVLWQSGPSSVRDIHEIIGAPKQKSYTTTLKIMQIMYEKGLLTRNESSKTHIYKAAISEKSSKQQAVGKIIKNLFKGSAAQLVMHALGNHRPSKEELDEIKTYLSQLDESADKKK